MTIIALLQIRNCKNAKILEGKLKIQKEQQNIDCVQKKNKKKTKTNLIKSYGKL